MFRICSFFLFVLTLAGGAPSGPADWIWSARYVITEDAQHRVLRTAPWPFAATASWPSAPKPISTPASSPVSASTVPTPSSLPA